LDVQPNEHLLIGDTPEAFAQAVIRLCQEPHLRSSLAAKALVVAREKYNWSTTLPRFLHLVERVVD